MALAPLRSRPLASARMRGLRRTVLVLSVASTICSLAVPALAFDATQYQVSVRHDGRVHEPGLAPPFARAWTIPMNAPGYPIIADGRVFVISLDGTAPGTKLRAIDLATGTVLWRKPIAGSQDWAAATYDGGRLFVITYNGILTAYDPATGTTLWTEGLSQYAFTAPPTSADGVVYVDGSGSGGTLYAVSELDGSILWTASVDDGDVSSPTLSDKRVFVQFACTLTQAFTRTTGHQVWQYDTGCSGGGGATAVLHNGLLYTRDNGDDRILDAGRGTLVGSYAGTTLPAFDKTSMYVLVKHRLRAVDLATGNVRWARRFDNAFVSNPLVVNNWVIEASSLGRIAAYKLGSGKLAWHGRTHKIGGPIEGQSYTPLTAMAAGNGYLVVPTITNLVAFRPAA